MSLILLALTWMMLDLMAGHDTLVERQIPRLSSGK